MSPIIQSKIKISSGISPCPIGTPGCIRVLFLYLTSIISSRNFPIQIQIISRGRHRKNHALFSKEKYGLDFFIAAGYLSCRIQDLRKLKDHITGIFPSVFQIFCDPVDLRKGQKHLVDFFCISNQIVFALIKILLGKSCGLLLQHHFRPFVCNQNHGTHHKRHKTHKKDDQLGFQTQAKVFL